MPAGRFSRRVHLHFKFFSHASPMLSPVLDRNRSGETLKGGRMSGRWLVVLILIPRALAAGELVSVPWEEVKGLYQEKAERKAMEKMRTETAKRPPVYTIDEGVYRLSIGRDSA